MATAPPWVPSGGQAPDPQEGGGDFSKRGEVLTETNPVPIFMREVKKNVVFQAQKRGKRGEFEEKEKRVRKRKSGKGVLWCDFGQLIERSMLFFVLFGWLRWLCCVIFGGQWVFCVERRKRKSRSRDRGYGRERSTERDKSKELNKRLKWKPKLT